MHSNLSIKGTNKNYDEMPQEFRMRFAWVIQKEENKFEKQHGWVVCRDFLGDYQLAHKLQMFDFEIYRFTVKDTKPTQLLALDFPKEEYKNIFMENIDKLRNIEHLNNLELTTIVAVNNSQSVIKVPEFWTSSNVLLSLYTFLLKIFSYTKEDPFKVSPGTEAQYILATEEALKKVLNNLNKLKFPTMEKEWEKTNSIKSFHNNSGFVSYLSKSRHNDLKNQLEKL